MINKGSFSIRLLSVNIIESTVYIAGSEYGLEFGIGLLANRPVKELLHTGLVAESAGFDTAWITDMAPITGDRFPFTVLTLLAEHSERMRIGTCVVSPYKWHPTLLAECVATLDELAPQRVILGVAVGGDCLDNLGWEWDRPIRTMRETFDILPVYRMGIYFFALEIQ